jgi:signal transduction histidine kinase
MKLTLCAAAAQLVLLIFTWQSFNSLNAETRLLDESLNSLNELALIGNTLHRDVLRSRAGMQLNYDPLVHETQALNDTLDQLRRNAPVDAATAAAIARLTASVGDQEDLVEQFKSNNALLRNSLAYFALFGSDLQSTSRIGVSIPAAGPVVAAMLRLTLDATAANAREVRSRLDELAEDVPASGDGETIQALLAHGRLLSDLLPATDGILRALSSIPRQQDLQDVRAAILGRQEASRHAANRYRLILYATSLLLVASLVYLGLLLRKRAEALRRRAAFEHMLANISMRFINAQPQQTAALIEQALAEMAEGFGLDRAYLLVPSCPNAVVTWCRPETPFPPGWPHQAPALFAESTFRVEGTVHIPNIGRLPADARGPYAAFGLRGWSCISNIGENGLACLLGFDQVLEPGCHAQATELGLLRMALNSIANAIEREYFELERARLQQARRMETIGTLASGIAHNFNNIICAILGYTEMIELQGAADSRTGRNLLEIRRSGERARDLVDQILTLGQRREPRRTHVKVEALIDETASLLQVSLPADVALIVQHRAEGAAVSGEIAQLQQVIVNLCNNAAQATNGSGQITIETDFEEIEQPRNLSHGELPAGYYVVISVRDTGRGMDEATLEQLLKPFFTTRPTGHGLGLATVRAIVREHGGAIDVFSRPGAGSRFEVWLSRVAAPSHEARPVPPPLPLGHGQTVLLLNEEPGRLLIDEEMLAALGYKPVGFAHADDAFAAYQAAPVRFDAVVISHVRSTQAAEIVASLSRWEPDIPIVWAAASADDLSWPVAAAACVRYPLSGTELAGTLTRCLAQRSRSSVMPMPSTTAVAKIYGLEIPQ